MPELDPHKLVERVREVAEQTEEDGERELQRRDRPPRSAAQRGRAEGADPPEGRPDADDR